MKIVRIVFGVLFLAAFAAAQSPLHQKVLYTQVRVRAEKAGGSGTVIYSEKAGEYFSTYIITCHHVVADAITVETKWDSLRRKDRKVEVRKPILVEFFNWRAVPHAKQPLTSGANADIVAYSVEHDTALIHLELGEKAVTAALLPKERIQSIIIGTPVLAVGCALLHDPIVTYGTVTHQGDIIDGKDYWMSNAQIIFGNSGGAVFTQDYSFIGVPSRVDVIGWGSPVTHLGYFSPITRVYEFFENSMMSFLVPGSGKTEAQCLKERQDFLTAEEKRQP